MVDQFAPKRKASCKEKKLRLKPWITNGLLKSIQNKNKMFIRLQNQHDNLALNRDKAYRNTLNRSLRLAQQNHYHSILNKTKGNLKKAREIINELALNKKRPAWNQLNLSQRLKTL